MKKLCILSNRYCKFLVTLAIVSIIIYSCAHNDDGSELYDYEDGVYYLELDGSSWQMGYKHGTAFKEQIRYSVEKYKESIYEAFGEDDGKKIIDWAVNKAGFTNDLKEYLPHVYQEIEAIAQGAELPVEDILLLNMDDEIFYSAPIALDLEPKQSIAPAATLIQAQVEDDEKLCAQNISGLGSHLYGNQLLIRYKYPNREIFIYTFIGRLGGPGVNNQGLSVMNAKLPQGRTRKSDGLGTNYTLRLLLEKDSVENAIETLKTIRKYSANAYAIADYKQSVITEESGEQFVSSPMLQYPGYQCHTNHMLWIEPEDRVDIEGAFENGRPLEGSSSLYTVERLEQAKGSLKIDLDDVDDDHLERVFTSPDINCLENGLRTVQSIIFEYDEDEIDVIISAGADPKREWNDFDF